MNQYNFPRFSALRVLAAMVIVLAFGSTALAQFQVTNFNGVPVVADEIVIRLRSQEPAALVRLRNVLPGANVEAISQQLALHVVRLPGQSMAGLLRALSNLPDVLYAEPNYVLSAVTTPNDTFYSSLWGMAQISAPLAWDVTTGSTSAVIGVVDTGVDYNHPDLAANMWAAPSAFSVVVGGYTINCPAGSHGYNALTRSCDPQDDNNHGTHVSGTIAATGNNSTGVVGVNWTARVMGLKFLNSSGNGTTAGAIQAIEFARQVKRVFASTSTPVDVRVLSNSWESSNFSQGLLDEINLVNTDNILFVAAAGNYSSNNDIIPIYPANYSAPNVITVAATDSAEQLAGFSNYSATRVHLGAPGQVINSTVRSGGYAYLSGTSMATPHVAGAALLTLAACPSLSTAALKSAILNSVDPLPSLEGYTITGGRLNVNRAVRSCLPVSPTATFTSLVSSANPAAAGASVTFTATVSGSNPTGSVNFTDGGNTFNGCGAVALSGSGNSRTAACTSSSLTAGTHSIVAAYSGDGLNAASASPPLSQMINPAAGTVVNPSFEMPPLGGGFQYNPSGSGVGWNFNSAGIQGNGSAWGAAAAPLGSQTAFIQGQGSVSQTLALNAGTYTLSFQAARRFQSVPAGGVQPIRVSVDGTQIGLISPASTSFALFTLTFSIAGSGSHTLDFSGTDGTGDKSTFLDAVSLTTSAPGTPSFTSPGYTSFTEGLLNNFTVQTTGSPIPALSRTGNLPSGVSFTDNGDGTGSLAGMPGAGTAGIYPLTFTASNTAGTVNQNFTLTVAPALLVNAGFETPFFGSGFQYNPSGAGVGWNFLISAGIQGNGSAWGAAAAPEGTQTAFIQGVGTMAQTITLNAGTYALVFQAARRSYSQPADGVQPIQVSVDGIPVGGTVSPASTNFSSFTVEFSIAAPGLHTIQLAGTDGSGDKSTFIDGAVVLLVAP